MQVVGGADIDCVDIVPLEQLAPIAFDRLVTPIVGKGLGLFLVTGTQRLEDRFMFALEKVRRLDIRVGMRLAHEAITDHTDA